MLVEDSYQGFHNTNICTKSHLHKETVTLSWWSMHIRSQTAGIIFIFLINSRDSRSFAMFCKAPVHPSAISIMLIPSWSFSSSVPTISRTAADKSFTKCEIMSWFLKNKVAQGSDNDSEDMPSYRALRMVSVRNDRMNRGYIHLR